MDRCNLSWSCNHDVCLPFGVGIALDISSAARCDKAGSGQCNIGNRYNYVCSLAAACGIVESSFKTEKSWQVTADSRHWMHK
jgi:hypothetical protein